MPCAPEETLMSHEDRYEKAKAVALQTGTWPDERAVSGCDTCPFRHESEKHLVDGCAAESTMWTKFTTAEQAAWEVADNYSPEWCPLRFGTIRVRAWREGDD